MVSDDRLRRSKKETLYKGLIGLLITIVMGTLSFVIIIGVFGAIFLHSEYEDVTRRYEKASEERDKYKSDAVKLEEDVLNARERQVAARIQHKGEVKIAQTKIAEITTDYFDVSEELKYEKRRNEELKIIIKKKKERERELNRMIIQKESEIERLEQKVFTLQARLKTSRQAESNAEVKYQRAKMKLESWNWIGTER